jgi:hypothetical protein
MVRDDQQRLHSLLLALGGDNRGFKLFDREWQDDLVGKARGGKRSRRRWSQASSYLDLERFLAQYSKADQNLGDVEFQDVPMWTIVDRTTGQSKEVRSLTYTNPIGKHSTAEGHLLFAEQLLPKVISALGGSHVG